MKKLITIFVLFIASFAVFADEAFLLKSDSVADFDGYDYVSNFEIVSDSGWFPKENLMILKPNEKGFRFLAKNVPENVTTSYKIIPSYPSFLNEADIGAGHITNVSNIKAFRLVYTTNRPYDEISILYSTSEDGPIHTVKMKPNNIMVTSMSEVVVDYELPSYQADITKRELKAAPVFGGDVHGIFLRGLKITTNMATGANTHSDWSILYVKEISVIYDNMFTEEQLNERAIIAEEFRIEANKEIREKASHDVQEKLRLREHEKQLIHTDVSTETETETGEK